jgi:L-alanine-DL-glutamate epimerase-like enolase superfamily enzyme
MANGAGTPLRELGVAAYRIPTDQPESDGTLTWDSTTLVVVGVKAGAAEGLGYSYADTATAVLIRDKLREVVEGRDAMDVAGSWYAMVAAIRNLGRPGIVSMAISAVDFALWDVKARLLGISLLDLLGAVRDAVPIYGSGGFTSYDIATLQQQLGGWAASGIPRVKMKIGREPQCDVVRVAAAREAIGRDTELFVDANGAYSRKQALGMAECFAASDVRWFEEPVTSDDLEGLRLIRDNAPAPMEVAAGEYGYDADYFRRMLGAGAVDVLQADASRCAGLTGFLEAAGLCEASHVPLSAHCAPSLHVHAGCARECVRHLEYFHDHVRIEHMLFDGALEPVGGELRPDRSRPGLGLTFRAKDAERYAL